MTSTTDEAQTQRHPCRKNGHAQTELHKCPYKVDIEEDEAALCSCCDDCTNDCADDI